MDGLTIFDCFASIISFTSFAAWDWCAFSRWEEQHLWGYRWQRLNYCSCGVYGGLILLTLKAHWLSYYILLCLDWNRGIRWSRLKKFCDFCVRDAVGAAKWSSLSFPPSFPLSDYRWYLESYSSSWIFNQAAKHSSPPRSLRNTQIAPLRYSSSIFASGDEASPGIALSRVLPRNYFYVIFYEILPHCSWT